MPQPSGSPSPTTGLDPIGRQIGDYRLLRRLGSGGMADVYLAEQQSLRRQVAIKILKPRLACQDAYVRRFHNEARAAASLVHANIVQIHEVGCQDGLHFLAQEYVPGGNLRQWLERQGTVNAGLVAHILRQAAAALSKAGQRGIVHRDIKPENIMLAAGGEIKIADFGLARVMSDEMSLTQIGTTMGTPLYMSPEQAQARDVDPRSDIYSLGVTCYQLLAGRPPFEGENALAVAMQHLHDEPRRLEELRPDAPIGLCCLIHRMLAKRPEDRHQSAAQLLDELASIAGLEAAAPTHPSGPASGSISWDVSGEGGSRETPSRFAATQRLSALLARRLPARRLGGRRLLVLLAAGVAGLATGAGLAALRRVSDPLAAVTTDELLGAGERRETIDEQYLHATLTNTEQAWLGVEQFPIDDPKNTEYVHRARGHRAALYFETGRESEAIELYRQLAALGETEVEFRAIGLVGLANLFYARQEMGSVERALGELKKLLAESPRLTRDPTLDLNDVLRQTFRDGRPLTRGHDRKSDR